MSELASGEAAALAQTGRSERTLAAATAAIAVGILTLVTAGALFISATAIGLTLFGVPKMVVWGGVALAGAGAIVVAGRFSRSAWRYELSA